MAWNGQSHKIQQIGLLDFFWVTGEKCHINLGEEVERKGRVNVKLFAGEWGKRRISYLYKTLTPLGAKISEPLP